MKKYEITLDATRLDEVLKELDQYIDKFGNVSIDEMLVKLPLKDMVANISLKGIAIEPIEWYNIVVGSSPLSCHSF